MRYCSILKGLLALSLLFGLNGCDQALSPEPTSTPVKKQTSAEVLDEAKAAFQKKKFTLASSLAQASLNLAKRESEALS